MLLQGKEGGEIVYDNGQPFKAYMILDTLKEAAATADDEEECDAKVEVYEDALDTVTEIDENVNEALGIHPKTENEDEEEE